MLRCLPVQSVNVIETTGWSILIKGVFFTLTMVASKRLNGYAQTMRNERWLATRHLRIV